MERLLCRGVLAIIFLVAGYALHIGGWAAADVPLEASRGIQALITTSELVVGQNRFAFGLLKANKLLEDADVTLRVHRMEGAVVQLPTELNAPYQAVGIRQQRSVHRHSDGAEHVHGGEFDIRGLYVTQLNFTQAGTWGIEISAHKKRVRAM
jgi:hypothetical protein